MKQKYAKKAQRSHRYFLDNEKQLRLEYTGQYVAIDGEEVVASSPNHSDLVAELDSRGYELKEVFIKYVRDSKEKVVR